jgi:hypothetical protein
MPRSANSAREPSSNGCVDSANDEQTTALLVDRVTGRLRGKKADCAVG